MRGICVLVALLFGAVPASAQTLQDARQRLLRGNYAEARELYATLAKKVGFKAVATIGLSKALQSEGEYDEALAVVEAALKESPRPADVVARQADLLARRAEVLYLRGRWEQAEKSAAEALALDGDHFLAHWIKGQVLRDRGDIKPADEEFRWFVRTYTGRSNMDKDLTDPEELLLVGLAGCERARWHNLSGQFRFILNEVWTEAVKQDKDFWPAEYESGRLLQEKYNKAGATRSFDKTLAINPRAAEVFAQKGFAALQRFDIKDAEHFAQKALAINPRLTDALRLQADIHLFANNLPAAKKDLAKARAVNPREEATLARLAACAHLERRPAEFAALVAEAEKHNPKPAIFYYEVAESLEQRRLFDQAEKYLHLAVKLQPQLPFAKNGLGLLYMRQGREDEARKVLEPAFEADPFNVRVFNTLQVLDHLKKYDTLKTEHFHLRYDPANDKVLAAFMAKYLEEIYAELAEQFQYRPKGPILIEVFNKHEMFSGRVTQLPDLHTIGACTGSMVAMVSPRDKSKVIGKPFNWVRVLRHELVHIFNLEQTKFQVPHWFTEGLAVQYEGSPPPPSWNQLLAEKFQSNELLNLDNILLGFIRPSSPDEWHQAYLQSLLYVQYLAKAHGDRAVAGLLAAFSDGLDTGAAIEKVCKVSKTQFEKGYRAFLEERVKQMPTLAAKRRLTSKELEAAHTKDPQNADVAAQLAERRLDVNDKDAARKLTEEVLKTQPKHPLASYVKARLALASGDKGLALALLEAVVAAEPPEVKVIKLLAKLQFEDKKFESAAQTLERGRKLEPHEPSWLVQLGRVHIQTGNKTRLIDVLKDLVPTDADDLVTRRKLAELLAEQKNHAEAERYARMALEIDVLDRQAQQILENALSVQNKQEELRQLRKMLEQ